MLQIAVAREAKNAMKNLGGNEYSIGTAADMLGNIQLNNFDAVNFRSLSCTTKISMIFEKLSVEKKN